MKNHYRTLGLDQRAEPAEVRAAYRKLAKRLHPDANGGDAYFARLFGDVRDAYEVLGDPGRRRAYDAQIAAARRMRDARTPTTTPRTPPRRSPPRPAAEAQRTPPSSGGASAGQPGGWLARVKRTERYRKLRTVGIATLCALPLLGAQLNAWSGFFAMAVFSGAVAWATYTLLNLRTVDTIGYGLAALLLAPLCASAIGAEAYDFVTERRGATERARQERFAAREAERARRDSVRIAEAARAREAREAEARERERVRRETLAALTAAAVKRRAAPPPPPPSRYRGHRLVTGASPFDECFGRGVYRGPSWVKFENGTERDAVVCLTRIGDGRVVRNAYIRAGATFEMSRVPPGRYYTKTYYGRDWNPTLTRFCGGTGGFEADVQLSQSQQEWNTIDITNDGSEYMTYTITLQKVLNGNFNTREVSAEEFFKV